jgi:glycosyltransferase involved in cell wall biosynthesis
MTSVNVLIDDQIFLLQRRGGISRYFVELLREFHSADLGVKAVTPYGLVRNEHLIDAFPGTYRGVPHRLDRPARRLARASVPRRLVATGVRMMSRRHRKTGPLVDLVHHTYYGADARQPPPGVKRVCTVVDMIPELMPDAFPSGNPHRDKRHFVMEADGVICISETTRRDMERCYGELAKPVAVIHLGVGPEFGAAFGGVPPLAWPYVLFVGQRAGYKNADVLLRAWPDVVRALPDLRLVMVGGGAFSRSESALVTELGIQESVVRREASDAELPTLYAGARAFVFPSRYEGFGLPVLEALAAGTPAVLSDTDCLREVGGAATSYFDPDDPRGLAQTLITLLTDEDVRHGLVAAGRSRAAEFSWRRTAEQTAAFYRRVMEERP